MGWDNGLLFWVSVEHRNILYVQPPQSGNRGIPKEGNERGPIQLRAWQKVSGMDWQRAVERVKGEGGRGAGNQSASCPQLKYLEVLRWSGELERRTSELVGLLEFLFVLASQVCLNDLFWKCIRRSSYTGTEEKRSIPDIIIYELILYTKYHYSKAPSPGVNDCFVSFVFFGIDLPVKSFWYWYNLKREICDLNKILQLSPQRAIWITRLILEMDILMTKC